MFVPARRFSGSGRWWGPFAIQFLYVDHEQFMPLLPDTIQLEIPPILAQSSLYILQNLFRVPYTPQRLVAYEFALLRQQKVCQINLNEQINDEKSTLSNSRNSGTTC